MDLDAKIEEYLYPTKGTGVRHLLEEILSFCIGNQTSVDIAQVLKLAYSKQIDVPPDGFGTTIAIYVTLLHWGTEGLAELTKIAHKESRSKSTSRVFTVLVHAASGTLSNLTRLFDYYTDNLEHVLRLSDSRFNEKSFRQAAKLHIFDLFVNLQNDPFATSGLFRTFELIDFVSHDSEETKRTYFAALANGWFGLSQLRLDSYEKLLGDGGIAEEQVHVFLNDNPFILEPFFAQIWSKEKLGEDYIADFIVRLMDDSYLIVEIEKPSDQIMTKLGNLSAKATHAIRQALEYRQWMVSNLLYARQTFENLRQPTCLIVIGMESQLTPIQAERLKQENESRNGIVKIVGFDWLHQRAETVWKNIGARSLL